MLSALGLVLAPAAFDIARTRKTPLQALEFRRSCRGCRGNADEIAAKLQEVAQRPGDASRSRSGSATSGRAITCR